MAVPPSLQPLGSAADPLVGWQPWPHCPHHPRSCLGCRCSLSPPRLGLPGQLVRAGGGNKLEEAASMVGDREYLATSILSSFCCGVVDTVQKQPYHCCHSSSPAWVPAPLLGSVAGASTRQGTDGAGAPQAATANSGRCSHECPGQRLHQNRGAAWREPAAPTDAMAGPVALAPGPPSGRGSAPMTGCTGQLGAQGRPATHRHNKLAASPLPHLPRLQ